MIPKLNYLSISQFSSNKKSVCIHSFKINHYYGQQYMKIFLVVKTVYLKYFHVEICPLGTAYVIKAFDCWHWNKQIQRKTESDTEDCIANRRLIKDLAQIYFVFFKCYVFQQILAHMIVQIFSYPWYIENHEFHFNAIENLNSFN